MPLTLTVLSGLSSSFWRIKLWNPKLQLFLQNYSTNMTKSVKIIYDQDILWPKNGIAFELFIC